MAAPPISWLQFAQQEIDRVFGDGYAAANPRLVASVVASAASDWAAATIANALRDVAVALLEDGEPAEPMPHNIVRSLLRP